MDENYGQMMGEALAAVRMMHSDCSRLLLDLDHVMTGWAPIHGNYVTADLTYDIKSGSYLAEGMYRHYSCASEPSSIRSVNICFFDRNDPALKEPTIIVSRITYLGGSPHKGSNTHGVWDPWTLFFSCVSNPVLDEVVTLEGPCKSINLVSATLLAARLYSIQELADLETIIRKVS